MSKKFYLDIRNQFQYICSTEKKMKSNYSHILIAQPMEALFGFDSDVIRLGNIR